MSASFIHTVCTILLASHPHPSCLRSPWYSQTSSHWVQIRTGKSKFWSMVTDSPLRESTKTECPSKAFGTSTQASSNITKSPGSSLNTFHIDSRVLLVVTSLLFSLLLPSFHLMQFLQVRPRKVWIQLTCHSVIVLWRHPTRNRIGASQITLTWPFVSRRRRCCRPKAHPISERSLPIQLPSRWVLQHLHLHKTYLVSWFIPYITPSLDRKVRTLWLPNRQNHNLSHLPSSHSLHEW